MWAISSSRSLDAHPKVTVPIKGSRVTAGAPLGILHLAPAEGSVWAFQVTELVSFRIQEAPDPKSFLKFSTRRRTDTSRRWVTG